MNPVIRLLGWKPSPHDRVWVSHESVTDGTEAPGTVLEVGESAVICLLGDAYGPYAGIHLDDARNRAHGLRIRTKFRRLRPREGHIRRLDWELHDTHTGRRSTSMKDETLHIRDTLEYQQISDHYRGKFAKRSGLPYMKHIDEGLAILASLGVTDDDVFRAWCLHPILQVDESFGALAHPEDLTLSPRVMMLAMEYRAVANAYLRPHGIRAVRDIQLSPLEEVNNMLRADKIQNYRDAREHHNEDKTLHAYFSSWLRALGVRKSSW